MIRLATLADVPLLPEIERSSGQAFRATPHVATADDGVTEADEYPPLVEAGAVWVVEADGELAGFVVADPLEGALHVRELAVALNHQRKGLGRRLMAAVIAHARALGLPALTLTTFENVVFNGPFYESLGFRFLRTPPPHLADILAGEAARGLSHRVAMRLEIKD